MRAQSPWYAALLLVTVLGLSCPASAQEDSSPVADASGFDQAKTTKAAATVPGGIPDNAELLKADTRLTQTITGRPYKRRTQPLPNFRGRRPDFQRAGSQALYIIVGDLDIALNGSCEEDVKTFCPTELRRWSELAGEPSEDNTTEVATPEETTVEMATEEAKSEAESVDPAASTRRLLTQDENTSALQNGAPGGSPRRGRGTKESDMQRLQQNRKDLEQIRSRSKDPLGGLKQELVNVPASMFTVAPMASCLRKAIRKQRWSLLASQESQVSSTCKVETREFWQARSADLRRDLPLLGACIGDIKQRCNSTEFGMGRVLRCLKNEKAMLNPRCAAAVTARQVESAEDISLDAPLQALCAAELAALCSDVGYGSGARLACLKDNRPKLGPKCSTEVFRREVEDSEDVRFQFRLAAACASEKDKFCASEPTGRARTLACLQAHMEETEFGAECKAEVEKVSAAAAADWRLDWRLRTFCFKDAKTLCYQERLAAKQTTFSEASNRTSVLECLHRNAVHVQSEPCKRHLTKRMSMAAGDIRYDMSMAVACYKEIRGVCKSVRPGGGRMQMCLESNKAQLSPKCATKLEQRSQTQATNWRYKHGVFSDCKQERKKFCSEVKEGGNRVSVCLQDHLNEASFSAECRAAVSRDEVKATGDVRLLPEVHDQCKPDIQKLCPKVVPGRGRVLRCLKLKRSEIALPGCRAAILRQMMRSTENWKLDRPLAEKCMGDVVKLCQDVPPGRVHDCLRKHEDQLSVDCRQEEARLEVMEAEDIRLKPFVRRLCEGAIDKHCKNIDPGEVRVLTCLKEKAGEAGFPAQCGHLMKKEVSRAAARTSLNPRVTKWCKPELERQCPGSKAGNSYNADGLKCLVHGYQWTSPFCQSELSKSVRVALNLYKTNVPLTQECDADAERLCSFTEEFSIYVRTGSVSQCLLRSASNLTDDCWKLVTVAVDDGEGRNVTKKMPPTKVEENKKSASKKGVPFSYYLIGFFALACVVLSGLLYMVARDRWPYLQAVLYGTTAKPLKGYVVLDKGG